MKITPAASNAATIRSLVSGRPPIIPSEASSLLMVGTDTPELLAASACDQASSARAALIWRIDTFRIDLQTARAILLVSVAGTVARAGGRALISVNHARQDAVLSPSRKRLQDRRGDEA